MQKYYQIQSNTQHLDYWAILGLILVERLKPGLQVMWPVVVRPHRKWRSMLWLFGNLPKVSKNESPRPDTSGEGESWWNIKTQMFFPLALASIHSYSLPSQRRWPAASPFYELWSQNSGKPHLRNLRCVVSQHCSFMLMLLYHTYSYVIIISVNISTWPSPCGFPFLSGNWFNLWPQSSRLRGSAPWSVCGGWVRSFLFHLSHLVVEQGSDVGGAWLHPHLVWWRGLHPSWRTVRADSCLEHCDRGKTVLRSWNVGSSLTAGAVFFLWYTSVTQFTLVAELPSTCGRLQGSFDFWVSWLGINQTDSLHWRGRVHPAVDIDMPPAQQSAGDQPEASEAGGNQLVPNQLAILVPSFDPSRDDIRVYAAKVELLTKAWPTNRYNELATRLILGCTGSAFHKLQLRKAEFADGTEKSIAKIIEVLGGDWGQVPLEKKYESAWTSHLSLHPTSGWKQWFIPGSQWHSLDWITDEEDETWGVAVIHSASWFWLVGRRQEACGLRMQCSGRPWADHEEGQSIDPHVRCRFLPRCHRTEESQDQNLRPWLGHDCRRRRSTIYRHGWSNLPYNGRRINGWWSCGCPSLGRGSRCYLHHWLRECGRRPASVRQWVGGMLQHVPGSPSKARRASKASGVLAFIVSWKRQGWQRIGKREVQSQFWQRWCKSEKISSAENPQLNMQKVWRHRPLEGGVPAESFRVQLNFVRTIKYCSVLSIWS